MTGVTTLVEVAGAPVLVWRAESPWLAISSGVLGGGFGERSWVLNATVSPDYDRSDPDRHLAEIAAALDLPGAGIGLLTAVDVREVEHRVDSGVQVSVTTGIGAHPTWAAAPAAVPEPVGTINAVCWLPRRLTPAALVNAVATVAEAKAQALFEAGVPGTGTPTDAVAILCPTTGPAETFCGPRSPVGGALARAVHGAILARL
jgi:adenosylcobinamide amidohydrolase